MNFEQQSNSTINTNKNLIKMSSIKQVTNANANANASSNASSSPCSNVHLYIPRASLRTTENQVREILFKTNIGIVDYCDLVVIKDKETKLPMYMSIFLKLDTWNPFSAARADFEENGSLKVFISLGNNEFWVILPNKNPIPRTHVNISQLAASTEKLFEQNEQIIEKSDKFQDEMRAEMAEMRLFMKLQQEKIETLEFKLTTTEIELNAKIEDLSFKNNRLNQLVTSINMEFWGFENGADEYYADKKKKMELADLAVVSELKREEKAIQDQFDAELDELLCDGLMDEQLPQLPQLPQPPKLTRIATCAFGEFEEDECDETIIVEGPQLALQPQTLCRTASVAYNEDDACIFTTRQQQRRSPIEVQSGSPGKSQTLIDIVAENPHRAIVSRDYCGNL